jgi:hypothetical protein
MDDADPEDSSEEECNNAMFIDLKMSPTTQ